MGITFDPKARQISALRLGRFAAPGEKAAKSAAEEPEDQLEISQEGRNTAVESEGGIGYDEMAEKLKAYLGSMTKEDFLSMVREQLGEPKQLEVSWGPQVDPDGSLWAKSYIDSLVSQVETARSTIEDYYSGAYQEALNSPLGSTLPDQLNFIAAKYQCSWLDYFDSSMPADQRQWTYTQVKAMLTGSQVKLNDPFALAESGLNVSSMDDIARKAASDKIQALVQQAREAAGAQAQPAAAGKASIAQQALSWLEEQNRKLWEQNQDQGATGTDSSELDLLSKAADVQEKCLKIAASIMKGDRVPPEDLEYLMKNDPEGYKLAMALRREKEDPEDCESVLDDEKKSGAETDNSGESPSVQSAEPPSGGNTASAQA